MRFTSTLKGPWFCVYDLEILYLALLKSTEGTCGLYFWFTAIEWTVNTIAFVPLVLKQPLFPLIFNPFSLFSVKQSLLNLWRRCPSSNGRVHERRLSTVSFITSGWLSWYPSSSSDFHYSTLVIVLLMSFRLNISILTYPKQVLELKA